MEKKIRPVLQAKQAFKENTVLRLSVVIPVHNGGNDFRKCLEALMESTRLPDELIVVDDASSDDSGQVASQYNSILLSQSERPIGPARCRNRGVAAAHGDIVIFLDADVRVHRDTIAVIEGHFRQRPEMAALFGSYDDQPPHRSLVSLYKNLQHHFVHHHSNEDAFSFWTGVGAIRRDAFQRVGGFNENYSRPSIEDIELGVRLKSAGYHIRLCKNVQVTHLKRWSLLNLLRTDIFDRAIPWTRLILSGSQLPADLNLDWKSRISALLVWGFFILLIVSFWIPPALIGLPALAGCLIAANFPLYRFFYQHGGLWFTTAALVLHFFYFFYSSLTFGLVSIEYLLLKKTN